MEPEQIKQRRHRQQPSRHLKLERLVGHSARLGNARLHQLGRRFGKSGQSRGDPFAGAVDRIVDLAEVVGRSLAFDQRLQVGADRLAQFRDIGVEGRKHLAPAQELGKRLDLDGLRFEQLQDLGNAGGARRLDRALFSVDDAIHRVEHEIGRRQMDLIDGRQPVLRRDSALQGAVGLAALVPAHPEHGAEADKSGAGKRRQPLAHGKIAFQGRRCGSHRESMVTDPREAESSYDRYGKPGPIKPADLMSYRSTNTPTAWKNSVKQTLSIR
ncbi:hypothetical protein D9M68_549990 [compost metagenome]